MSTAASPSRSTRPSPTTSHRSWADSDAGDDLDLNPDWTPIEDFAVGGPTNWVPAQANGPEAGETVRMIHQDEDYFIGESNDADETYFYDSNDTFSLHGSAMGMDDFERLITGSNWMASDVLDVDAYSGDPAGTSVFDVTDDNVPSPQFTEAQASDLDGDGTADDVTVTWSPVGQGDAIYNVYVDDVADGTFVAADDTLIEATAERSVQIIDGAGSDYHVGAEGGLSGEVSTGDPATGS